MKLKDISVISAIIKSQKLELQDRVFETEKLQCFATLKDHKKNFPQNPQVRLINPTKTEVGKPSKQILENIISTAVEKLTISYTPQKIQAKLTILG